MPNLFTYIRHPHIDKRKLERPPKVADQMPHKNPVERFNTVLALKITSIVGTMWCAYAFAAIALISLPDALRGGTQDTISWIAQTFLQLVLLSIIIVGQNAQAAASDARAQATYEDADAVLHTALEIQAHMQAQDVQIEEVLAQLQRLQAG